MQTSRQVVSRVKHRFLVLLKILVVGTGQSFKCHHETSHLLIDMEGMSVCVRALLLRVYKYNSTFPNTRPHFPRISSRESGFFFCGIRLLPVLKCMVYLMRKSPIILNTTLTASYLYASAKRTKSNSLLL